MGVPFENPVSGSLTGGTAARTTSAAATTPKISDKIATPPRSSSRCRSLNFGRAITKSLNRQSPNHRITKLTNLSSLLLSNDVLRILVVLFADVFDQLGVRLINRGFD